jgi:hypothetical protein
MRYNTDMNEHLKTLITTFSKIPTREEFTKAFRAVMDYVKRIEAKNKQDFDALTETITKKVEAKIKGLDGKDGYTPQKGIDYFDGERGDDGESIIGPKGEDGKDGKDGSPDKPSDIRDKLHSLKDDERLDIKYIKGYDDLEKRIAKGFSSIPRGRHSSAPPHPMLIQDLSTKTDGTTKAFSVPKSVSSIIHMSDFPHILVEGNGYTLNAARTTVTLTVANAPSAGSQLIFLYSALFNQTS